jgi:hypothetical protein
MGLKNEEEDDISRSLHQTRHVIHTKHQSWQKISLKLLSGLHPLWSKTKIER